MHSFVKWARCRRAHAGLGVPRAAAIVLLTAALGACASAPENPMSADQRRDMGITEVSVAVAEGAPIWWGDAERDFAESKNCEAPRTNNRGSSEVGEDEPEAEAAAPCDYDALIESQEARAYLEDRASKILTGMLTDYVQPHFKGGNAVRLAVTIREVHVASTGQALLLGGSHVLRAGLVVEDAATGTALARYDDLYVTGGYSPGGLASVAFEAASDDPVVRMAAAYADEAREWLKGEEDG